MTLLHLYKNPNLAESIEFIKAKHTGQFRYGGAPYSMHPLIVASILATKGYDEDTQKRGLFHDLYEDTDATKEEIIALSNEGVEKSVRALTKTKGMLMEDYIAGFGEEDIPVKLADRLNNVNGAVKAPKAFRLRYIEETEKYYIPLSIGTLFEDDLKSALGRLKKTV